MISSRRATPALGASANPPSGAAEAVGFLTILGRRRRRDLMPLSPSALAWFPLVGLGLGAALGLSWWGLERILPRSVAAVLVVAAGLVLTGLLHFDGLLDSADGLLPPLPRERRLEVMHDPHAGAFAVVTGAVLLLAQTSALASADPRTWWQGILLLAGLVTISRSLMVIAMLRLRYARPGGIASDLLGGTANRTAPLAVSIGGLVAGAAALVVWRHLGGVAVLLGSLAGTTGVWLLAHRRIGGFTGDVLGAAGVVGETVGLLVAAARW